jgi:hypothetical protein
MYSVMYRTKSFTITTFVAEEGLLVKEGGAVVAGASSARDENQSQFFLYR